MTSEERARLIEQYAAGFDQVAASLKDFPAPLRTERPFPNKWSAAEIVHHLADSEMTSAVRLRRLLVEEHPVIYGYDQEAFSAKLWYNERELEPALEAFRAARAGTVQLLRRMDGRDWQREGWHTEIGRYGPEDWLRIYAAHAHDHAAQIARLRDALTGERSATP